MSGRWDRIGVCLCESVGTGWRLSVGQDTGIDDLKRSEDIIGDAGSARVAHSEASDLAGDSDSHGRVDGCRGALGRGVSHLDHVWIARFQSASCGRELEVSIGIGGDHPAWDG